MLVTKGYKKEKELFETYIPIAYLEIICYMLHVDLIYVL